jgi:hypothetical protein
MLVIPVECEVVALAVVVECRDLGFRRDLLVEGPGCVSISSSGASSSCSPNVSLFSSSTPPTICDLDEPASQSLESARRMMASGRGRLTILPCSR